jgi:hypothetical protein
VRLWEEDKVPGHRNMVGPPVCVVLLLPRECTRGSSRSDRSFPRIGRLIVSVFHYFVLSSVFTLLERGVTQWLSDTHEFFFERQ